MFLVALRKESVDRNIQDYNAGIGTRKSLSARRAWIEIFVLYNLHDLVPVALRKESVDRNYCKIVFTLNIICRSPQGERG